jgi:glycosyl-4,4'-diaponeurosporenoate acyltransferase
VIEVRSVDVVGLFWMNFTVYWVWTLARILLDPLIPAAWLNPNRWPFRAFSWEDGGEYYRRVWRIETWKHRLPTFAGGTRFSKRSLTGSDPEYLNQFIVETCRGESNHVRAIGSVVIMKLWTPTALWVVLLAIAVAGNLPFIAIQRYNRPRLRRTLELTGHRAMLREAGGLQAESA